MQTHKTSLIAIGKTKVNPIIYCGKQIGIEVRPEQGFYQVPSETKATEGKHDYKSCEVCKQSLITYTREFTERYEGDNSKQLKAFPDCCEAHSKLEKIKEFKREDFREVPAMVARKVIYTNQHITNYLRDENWYKQITDYIVYTYESFGQMPLECGEPLFWSSYINMILQNIRNEKGISQEKRIRLIDFIETNYISPEKGKDNVSFNILISTYQKWLKLFPFELQNYFADYREQFNKSIMIFESISENNIYTGKAKGKLHSEPSLINALTKITKKLILQINTPEFAKASDISVLNKHRIELASESLRIETEKLTNEYSEGELRYIDTLKNWLQLQKDYFKEISGIVFEPVPVKPESKFELLVKYLQVNGFFELPKVKALSEGNKTELVNLLYTNGLPYSVAMFDFLGYINLLEKNYYPIKYKLYKEIAKWFNVDKDGRAVKGNLSSLIKGTTENKYRYTAHKHKEIVQIDYQKLK